MRRGVCVCANGACVSGSPRVDWRKGCEVEAPLPSPATRIHPLVNILFLWRMPRLAQQRMSWGVGTRTRMETHTYRSRTPPQDSGP